MNILSFFVGIMMAVSSFFHPQQKLGANVTQLPIVLANYSDSLASPITSSSTSMTLVSGEDTLGRALSGYYCFTVDGQTASSEFVCGTAAGTAVTSLIRGVDPLNPNATSASLTFAHRRGASVQITDYTTLGYVTRMLSGTDTVPGILQYQSGTSDASIAANSQNLVNYQTLSDTAIAGATNATTTTFGISKISVAPATSNDPICVGTNDTRIPTVNTSTITSSEVSALVGTGTPSGTYPYVTADTLTSDLANYQTTANLSTNTGLGNSNTLYPSQNAVQVYVNNNNPNLASVYTTTDYETATRFTEENSNGTETFGASGVSITTTSTGSRSAELEWNPTGGGSTDGLMKGSPYFSTSFNLTAIGTAGNAFIGYGDVRGDFSTNALVIAHVGFKIIFSSGPTATLYATQADGSTENVSSALTTMATTDNVDVKFQVIGTSSVNYYWRKNGGAWSSAVNLTSNLPSAPTTNNVSDYIDNLSTGTTNTIVFQSQSYIR